MYDGITGDWLGFISFFTIPTGFKITRYHVFQCYTKRPGYVPEWSFTSSETFFNCPLLQKDFTVYQVLYVNNFMNDPDMDVNVEDVSSFKSTNEGSSCAYILKNVLGRYNVGKYTIRPL